MLDQPLLKSWSFSAWKAASRCDNKLYWKTHRNAKTAFINHECWKVGFTTTLTSLKRRIWLMRFSRDIHNDTAIPPEHGCRWCLHSHRRVRHGSHQLFAKCWSGYSLSGLSGSYAPLKGDEVRSSTVWKARLRYCWQWTYMEHVV